MRLHEELYLSYSGVIIQDDKFILHKSNEYLFPIALKMRNWIYTNGKQLIDYQNMQPTNFAEASKMRKLHEQLELKFLVFSFFGVYYFC